MVAIYPEHHSRSARWSRRFAVLAVLLFVTAGAAHRFDRLPTETFLLVIGVVALLVLVSLIAFAVGFQRMWTRGNKVGSNLVVAALFLVGVLVPIGVLAYHGATTPMLYDISTDLQEQPLLGRGSKRTEFMNLPHAMTAEEIAAHRAGYPDLVGHSYALPGARMREIITTLVTERGWEITRPFPFPSGPAATLDAVAGTFLLGFPSDVAIRVADEDTATFVDMRSASRYGRHDFGDNAMRIKRFFADLDAAVLADARAPQPAQ